jgi:transcriptional regulator with XRE-family HTH domain
MGDDSDPVGPGDEAAELAEQRFAANLRAAREESGVSQSRLAEEMAARGWPWHQQTVTRVESGRRMVRLGEAKAVAEILETSLDRLTQPTEEMRAVEMLAAWIRAAETAYRSIAGETAELLRAKQWLRDHPAVTDIDPAAGKMVLDAAAEARKVLRLTPEGAVERGVAQMAAAKGWFRDAATLRPRSINEAGEIADALRRGAIVTVDLTDAPAEQAQRVLDFVHGATRVRGGTVTPAGDLRYRAVPAAADDPEWAMSESSGALAVVDPRAAAPAAGPSAEAEGA